MNIIICNMHQQKPQYNYDVRIDRKSIVGNPFYMETEDERNKVCNEFETHLLRNRKYYEYHLNLLLNIYKKYGKLRLFCWCVPKRCHGESIVKELERIEAESKL